MRFEQLHCLQEIARTGSITSAAKNLFISQQAVSNSVKQLEEELGVQLMIRSATGISLTAEGQEAVEFAQQMLNDRDNFKLKMNYRQEYRSSLKSLDINICSTSSVINAVLPKVLAELKLQLPKVTMHVSLTNHAEEIMHNIISDSYQIGLVTLNEQKLKMLCSKYDLEYDILEQDQVVGVIKYRASTIEKKYIDETNFSKDYMSLYGIEPQEEYKSLSARYISVSNDIYFHKNLIEALNAVVLLPGIAAKLFFHSSKYMILPLKDINAPLVHAAVYHCTIRQEYWDVVELIRKVVVQS